MSGTADPGTPALRVLMLSHFFPARRGGIELVAAALGRELAALGMQVHWLASGVPQDAHGEGAVRCEALAASSVLERAAGVPYPWLSRGSWRRVAEAARECDIVLVHDALHTTSLAGARAAASGGKPLVVVQHVGLVPYRSRLLRAGMALANRLIAAPLLERADQVIFISELTRACFGTLSFRRPPRTIFNGVDTAVFSPSDPAGVPGLRRALGLPEAGPVALFVGRFVEKKGLPVIEAMARQRPAVTFALAGHGAADPRTWGLPNVRVFGSLAGPAIADLYRAADVLVLPSVGEGFPLVIQEALACGLAVVCGRDTTEADPRVRPLLRAATVDLADIGGTASRFTSELDAALAPEPAGARSARAEFARHHYSWKAAAADYAALLRGLVRPSRSGA